MTEGLAGVTGAVLAGGLGTRLRAAVADRPKVLAPVHGRPYLAYLLRQLAAAGVRDVVLLTGHLGGQVRAALGDDFAGLRLAYSQEPSPLGTAGALRRALPLLGTPTVLLLNGDSYCAAPLADFRESHRRRRADLSLVLTPVEDCSRYGRVRLGRGGRVRGFEEKASGGGPGWVNAGIYLVNRELIEDIPPDVPLSLERDLCPAWAVSRRSFGFRCRAPFLDIGTPESYARAEAFFPPDPAAVLA